MFKKIFLILLFFSTISYGKINIICFNYGDNSLTTNTCKLFKNIVYLLFTNDNIEYVYLNNDKIPNGYYSSDIIYLAGYGQPNRGYWLDNKGKITIKWCDLLEHLQSIILIVDSCYSGMVFKCPNTKKFKYIITSTTENCMSVNNNYNGKFYSTISLMLACIVNLLPECENLPGCNINNFSPQLCQLSWILLKHEWTNKILYKLLDFPELHPNICIGTTLINNESWK